ncbi:MAG: Lrp/AsnC ligand binding domain-containing protein [Nitrosopumilaceae archaeon]
MTIAYVLINCDLGAEESIIEELKKLDQVQEVFETVGTHDLMAKLESEHLEKLREVITWNIQKIDKVRSTVTLVKKGS